MGGLGLGVGLAPIRNLEEEETSAGSSDEEDEIAPVSMVVPARLTCKRTNLLLWPQNLH